MMFDVLCVKTIDNNTSRRVVCSAGGGDREDGSSGRASAARARARARPPHGARREHGAPAGAAQHPAGEHDILRASTTSCG